MLLNVFAIHDAKAGFFQVPFYMPSVGQAVRALLDLCADGSNMIARHPGDFSLYHLGTFDDATGRFVPNEPFVHLGGGEAFMPNNQSRSRE